MQLYGITGPKFSGKTTFAKFFVEDGFERMAFVEPLKDALSALTGSPREYFDDPKMKEKVEPVTGWTYRALMEGLGTDYIRNVWGEDFFVKRMGKRIRDAMYQNPNIKIVIDDVRMDNEAQMIKDMGGRIIEIGRPGYDWSGKTPTETGINYDLIDYKVFNNISIMALRIRYHQILVDERSRREVH